MKEYRDHYFRKAREESYPARSVYKLKEMDAKFRLLKPGMRVLDLGAAPGSWSIGAAEKIGGGGLVLACDVQDTETIFPPQVIFMREDVFNRSTAFEARLEELGPFDAVLSDMAPRTTGSRITDQTRSLELAVEAFSLAGLCLKGGGAFVAKIFMGPDIRELLVPMRRVFATVKTFKPKSSRAESKEIFSVGLNFLPPKTLQIPGMGRGCASSALDAAKRE
ncbi:MAG: RlmE family RNA methyltransferase [Desulfovibrio sp.]|jgi:23S rRNA (uridine2552-2'-O)-methyltransferase|nr:RlmE family RNA methyltransferase [Desulfovibrio sp.]